jgi:quinol monooxygenase YgiN
MITVIAKLKCQEGKEEEAKALCAELVRGVQANEPGVLAYLCHESAKDPREIIFYEVYENQDALTAHGKTEHMMKMNKSFMSLFVPPPDIQKVERIEGFTR